MESNGDGEEGDMEDGFALGEGDLLWSRPEGVRTLRRVTLRPRRTREGR